MLQIHDEAKKFSYQTTVRVVVAYGGAPINQQVLSISTLFLHIYIILYSHNFSYPGCLYCHLNFF